MKVKYKSMITTSINIISEYADSFLEFDPTV